MGEQKRRASAGHVPPDGMANVSGRHVTELARGIMDLLEKPFDEGMQADIAAHVMVVTAVDLWRANYGDEPDPHGEHITTYGVSKVHCTVAAQISQRLQELMGWSPATKESA